MKERFIVHCPIDDNPEIPNLYSIQTVKKASLPKRQSSGTKWIRDMREEPEDVSISESSDNSPVSSECHREKPFYMLHKEWSRVRRENVLTLIVQMYEDDGKESTDAFLLEAIRSF
ncbi:MAG: hypothetical protein PHQ75_15305 [Thermoguttaceae bacterium]|nr:hypothetical protein [Thermoguttaceae bacterium]